MRRRRCVWAAFAAATIFAGGVEAGESSPTPGVPSASAAETAAESEELRTKEFAHVLDQLVATGDTVGLAIAVVRKGEVSFMRTYGVREAGGFEPVTPTTVFRLASLSKGVTGTLAAMAIAEGRLSADTPAAPYAPGLRLAGGREKALTIGHLLSHRTGLPRNAYDNLLEAGMPIDEILKRYARLKLQCAPGDCYAYQNIAFNFAGRAIEAVYGKSFDELATNRLFVPLGMETASVGFEGLSRTGNWARPHVRAHAGKGALDYGPWRVKTIKEAYYRVPAAGGVNASLLDLVAWLKAQMGYAPDVLPAYVLDVAHVRRTPSPYELARIRIVSKRFEQADYAFGWRRYVYAGTEVIAHSGTVDFGYAAQIAWLPKQDVGIVMLSNTRPRRIWRILPTFLDIELGLPREDWLNLEPDTPKTASGNKGSRQLAPADHPAADDPAESADRSFGEEDPDEFAGVDVDE